MTKKTKKRTRNKVLEKILSRYGMLKINMLFQTNRVILKEN